MLPCRASQPPSAITTTEDSSGIAASVGEKRALIPAARIRSANKRRPCRSSTSTMRASWPNPLTTRTPVTVSSTCWASSAARCWADQVAACNRGRIR